MVSKKKFTICHNKGFHMTFNNNWTVSVQFGFGNYCDNYNEPVKDFAKNYGKNPKESNTAEVWAWKGEKHFPSDPLGYQSPDEVFEFIKKVRRKK